MHLSRRSLCAPIALLLLCGLMPPAAFAATYQVVGPVRLEPAGTPSGKAVLTLRGEGVDLSAAPPQPKDLGIPDGGVTIQTTPLAQESTGSTIRVWKFEVTVSNLPPQALQKRYLGIAGTVQNLEFDLTNRPAESFSWRISDLPSEVSLGSEDEVLVGIVTGPVPATQVALTAVNLTEESTKRLLPLQLCGSPRGQDCKASFPLAAYSSNRLFLRTIDPVAGNYSGSISLATPEMPAGEKLSINLKAHVTTRGRQWLGVGALFLGVLLSWGVQYAQRRIARAQALLPVAALLESLADLEKRLPVSPGDFAADVPKTRGQIAQVRDALSENRLALYLPSVLNPFATASPGAGYQPYLDTQATMVTLLALVVREGIEPLLELWRLRSAPAGQKAAVANHLEQIDKQSTRQPPIDLPAVRLAVQAEVDAVDKLLTPKGFASNLSRPSPVSVGQLRFEIDTFGSATWMIWGFIAVVGGSGALVFSNLGFGVPLDYVKCLLWGLGLPAAGTQLATLTPAAVTSALRISVPLPPG